MWTLFWKTACNKPSVTYSGLRVSASTSLETSSKPPDRHFPLNCCYNSSFEGEIQGRKKIGSETDIPSAGTAGDTDISILPSA